MRIRYILFMKIFFLWLIMLFTIYGQNKVGTSAAPFLGIPIGPRAHAMGGAYIAVVNDVTAAFWNPGALSRINGTEIALRIYLSEIVVLFGFPSKWGLRNFKWS